MPANSNLKAASTAVSLLFYERFRGLYINSSKKDYKHLSGILTDSNHSRSSRMAREVTTAMGQISTLPVSRELSKRLSYAMAHWMESGANLHAEPASYLPGISGFRLNETTSINQKLEINIETVWKSNQLATVNIPAIRPRQDIIAPARTLKIDLKLAVATVPVSAARGTRLLKSIPFLSKSSEIITYNIPFNKDALPAKEFQLEVKSQPGTISLLLGSMQFKTMKNGSITEVTDKNWLPVDILSAYYSR